MRRRIAIAAWALDKHVAWIHLRGELERQAWSLALAIDEARAAGLLGPKVAGRDFALELARRRATALFRWGLQP